MDKGINDFISKKNIALLGMSRQKSKFGNYVYKELTSRGYNIYPVHPTENEIDGAQCYPNIGSIKDKVDGVFISVSPKNIPSILQEISSAGIINVWLQQGCESLEAIDQANKLGLNLVSKKCILMYAEPVKSIHKFHRMVANIFHLS